MFSSSKSSAKKEPEQIFPHCVNTNPVMPEVDEDDCLPALKELEFQRQKWASFLRNKKDIWSEQWIWNNKIRAEASSNQIKKKFLQIFSTKVKTQKQVKFLIRGGVPPELRGNVWWACSGASGKLAEALPEEQYKVLLTQIDEMTSTSIANDIEKDLLRTFPERINAGNSRTVDALRRVLRAYALRNPETGYCQSMNYICALLLFHMSEEQAFWVMAALIEDILPANYYTPSLLGGRVDQQVFQSCVAWKLPQVYSVFKSTNTLLEPIICPWFLCLYVNVLPLSVVCRVWDCMFWEGSVVLFRIGLTMIKSKTREIIEANDFIKIYSVLKVSNSKTYSFELESRDSIHNNSNPSTPNGSSLSLPPSAGGLDILQDFGSISRAEHLINSAFGFRWLRSVPKAKVEFLRGKFLALLEGDRAERMASAQSNMAQHQAAMGNSSPAPSSPVMNITHRLSGLFRSSSSQFSTAGEESPRSGKDHSGDSNKFRPLPSAVDDTTTPSKKPTSEAAELALAISKHKSKNSGDGDGGDSFKQRARTRQSLAMLRLLENLEYVQNATLYFILIVFRFANFLSAILLLKLFLLALTHCGRWRWTWTRAWATTWKSSPESWTTRKHLPGQTIITSRRATATMAASMTSTTTLRRRTLSSHNFTVHKGVCVVLRGYENIILV